MRKSILMIAVVMLPASSAPAESLLDHKTSRTAISGKPLPLKRATSANSCAAFGAGFVMVDGTNTCVDRRSRQHRRERVYGRPLSLLTFTLQVIGGAMNCVKPGRLANCANQRSRCGKVGLVTPSTPSQRRA